MSPSLKRLAMRASKAWTVALLLPLLPAARTPVPASEPTYPQRSVDLIVPWAAGGGSDRLARFIADALQRRLGQPVIVVNRTGGSGAVGHTAGALARPDGYTLTLATFELSTMKAMGISGLTWTNFTPVAQINADAAALIVRHDAPWRTLGDLLDAIRREPGRLKMSGTATGGAWDLARAGLLLKAGLAATNVIWTPAQGSAPALVELLGGHIDVVCCSVPEAAPQLEGGQARVLAVLSPQRLPLFAQYPTAREQGIDYEAVGWRGVMLPHGAPAYVVTTLSAHLAEITRSTEFAGFMQKNGFATEVRLAADFGAYLAEQEAKWRDVIHSAGYESIGRSTADPGPRTLPIALGLIFVAAVTAEILRSRRTVPGHHPSPAPATPASAEDAVPPGPTEDSTRPTPPGLRASRAGTLELLGALALYLVALPWTGFVPATAVFTLAMLWRQGMRLGPAVVLAGLLIAGIQLLFGHVFKVPLP